MSTVPTLSQIREKFSIATTVSKNKAGNFIMKRNYFYSNGLTGQDISEQIKTEYPAAKILGFGTTIKSFQKPNTPTDGSNVWVVFYF